MKKARNIAFFRVIRAIRVQKICVIREICVTKKTGALPFDKTPIYC